jgi:hypothetical protein
MRALFLSLALLYATTLVAQDSQSPTPTDRPLSQQTIRGCLVALDEDFSIGDASVTTYQLEADDGSNYRLEGDSTKLKELFGHEIEVAGTIGGSAASSSSSQSKQNTQTIQVLDVRDLSSSCKSGK